MQIAYLARITGNNPISIKLVNDSVIRNATLIKNVYHYVGSTYFQGRLIEILPTINTPQKYYTTSPTNIECIFNESN